MQTWYDDDICKGFNQPKTLSGIETQHSILRLLWIHRFNQPKTLSGIETDFSNAKGNMKEASTNLKPFQGLKL